MHCIAIVIAECYHAASTVYLDLSKYGGITSYDITLWVGFFQNDDNQVNIEDPIEDIMISE